MLRTLARNLGASALALGLISTPILAEAQSQASKTGLGVSRQTAGAASGQSVGATGGALSLGAVAAAVGLVVVIGVAVAVASGDGNSSASSTN
ncbi:MAG: hypothetical protein O3C65_11240 [Proteobacteria bacterium]|nr:hypothetical protein [Pseudomonadota bacterium]MDA1059251.1 hypothetical protein [Pseudomonadota bacterium]